MRQPSILLLITVLIFFMNLPVHSAVQGKVDYVPKIDYSQLSEDELELNARSYYFLAMQNQSDKITDEATKALNMYRTLQEIDPKNEAYCVKLGSLYDKLNQDKYAKENLSRAISINSTNPEPYFYFGEYYYKRCEFRKALKYYKKAYERGYMVHYETLCRMGDIYAKFGDTRCALVYFEAAYKLNPNPDLEKSITHLKGKDAENQLYNSQTRIRTN